MSQIRLDIFCFQQLGLQNLLCKIQLRAENTCYNVDKKLQLIQLDMDSLSLAINLYQRYKQLILWPGLKVRCQYDLAEVIENNSELEVELQELIFLLQSMNAESSAVQGIMFYARFVAFKNRFIMQLEIEALALGPLLDKHFSNGDLLSMYQQMMEVLSPAKMAQMFRLIIPVVDVKLRDSLLSLYKNETSIVFFNQVLNRIRADLPLQSFAEIEELLL